MAITVSLYDGGREALVKKQTALQDATLRASLHTSGYTFDATDTSFGSDVTNEITAAGYIPQDLSNVTLSLDDGLDGFGSQVMTVFCDDIDWGDGRSFSAVTQIVIRDYEDDRPIMHIDLDGSHTSEDGTFKYKVDVTYGLLRFGLNNQYS